MKWTDRYEKPGWFIDVPVSLIRAVGAKSAVLVSGIFIWTEQDNPEDGWLHKTKKEISNELGLSDKEQSACVNQLKQKKLLQTKHERSRHRFYYRLCKLELGKIVALQPLRPSPYREYLQSAEWKVRRETKLKQAGFRCQICNRSGDLNVHHEVWQRFA
jgi:hypothetical protein